MFLQEQEIQIERFIVYHSGGFVQFVLQNN